jgi:hypothetical protein
MYHMLRREQWLQQTTTARILLREMRFSNTFAMSESCCGISLLNPGTLRASGTNLELRR